MPVVFGTRARTRLVAFLSIHGTVPTMAIAHAFRVGEPGLMRSLQSARATGVIERLRRRCSLLRRNYHRVNRLHPAYAEIVALGKALGQHHHMPSCENFRARMVDAEPFERKFDSLNLFGQDASLPGRSEVLLFLSALGEPIPISRLAGVLRKCRFSILGQVKTLEASGMITSVWHGSTRLLQLNDRWSAHKELAALLRKLNDTNSQFADLATAYRAAGGAVAYIK